MWWRPTFNWLSRFQTSPAMECGESWWQRSCNIRLSNRLCRPQPKCFLPVRYGGGGGEEQGWKISLLLNRRGYGNMREIAINIQTQFHHPEQQRKQELIPGYRFTKTGYWFIRCSQRRWREERITASVIHLPSKSKKDSLFPTRIVEAYWSAQEPLSYVQNEDKESIVLITRLGIEVMSSWAYGILNNVILPFETQQKQRTRT